VKQFHDYSKEEIQSMLDRTAVLLEGLLGPKLPTVGGTILTAGF